MWSSTGAAGIRAGALAVDMRTIDPEASGKLKAAGRERQLGLLDANRILDKSFDLGFRVPFTARTCTLPLSAAAELGRSEPGARTTVRTSGCGAEEVTSSIRRIDRVRGWVIVRLSIEGRSWSTWHVCTEMS